MGNGYLSEPKKLFKQYWIYLALAAVVLAVAFGGYQACKSDPLQEAIDKQEAAKEEFKEKEAAQKEALEKLKLEGAKQEGKNEELRKNAEKATKEAEEARAEADQAVEKVKAVEESYESGISIEEAERNRCKAFPERCKK